MYYHHPNRHILTDLAFSAHESLNQNTTCKGLWSSDSSIRYGSESGSEDTPHKNRFAVITSEYCSLTGGCPEAISCGCADSKHEKGKICPVLAHHAQFSGMTKRVVKGIVWSNNHKINRNIKQALENSFEWDLDKPIVTMIMPKNKDSAIEIKKMKLIENIRTKNLERNICVSEFIFCESMQNTMLLETTKDLPDTHKFVVNNRILDVIYTSDAGLPLEGLLRTDSRILKNLKFSSLYAAIGNLIYTYFKISQKGIFHLDFKTDNILYNIDKHQNVVFSIIDFGQSSGLEKYSLEEGNCMFHHGQLRDIRYMSPAETYFFEIIVHLFFDNIIKNKCSEADNNRIRGLWAQRKKNMVITSRNNIQNLFVILKNFYSNALLPEDLNNIWENCFQALNKVFTGEMKQRISRDTKMNSTNQFSTVYGQCTVYEEIYTKFCSQYYTGKNDEQEQNRNSVLLHYDRHSLGIVILELLKARGLNDGANCTKSLSLVNNLMLGSEKLSNIWKAFVDLAKQKDKFTKHVKSTPLQFVSIYYRQQNQGYIPQMQPMYIPQMQMHQPQAMQQMQYQHQHQPQAMQLIHPMQHQHQPQAMQQIHPIQQQHQPYPMQHQQIQQQHQPYPMQHQQIQHKHQHQQQQYPMQHQQQPYPMQYQQQQQQQLYPMQYQQHRMQHQHQ